MHLMQLLSYEYPDCVIPEEADVFPSISEKHFLPDVNARKFPERIGWCRQHPPPTLPHPFFQPFSLPQPPRSLPTLRLWFKADIAELRTVVDVQHGCIGNGRLPWQRHMPYLAGWSGQIRDDVLISLDFSGNWSYRRSAVPITISHCAGMRCQSAESAQTSMACLVPVASGDVEMWKFCSAHLHFFSCRNVVWDFVCWLVAPIRFRFLLVKAEGSNKIFFSSIRRE